jgi:ATP-dependent protease ClpP protease subunit
MVGALRTARPRAQLRQGRTDWYRITNAIGGGTATVHIYDEIGWFGITAAEFVAELSQVQASAIDVHLNSPGGEIFDGIAIANSLRAHPATVNVYVDSLAASIASVIAMAGDRVVMAPNSQLMIHDGSGLCIGNAAAMRGHAELLDRQSDNIASVYADRAGGTVAEWRERMQAETWYTAEEAVEAGLADEVSPSSRTSTTENSPQNSWDLSIFRYPSRAEAPAPVPVNAAVVDPPAPTESVAVEQTAEAPAEELEPPAAAEAEVETDTTPLTEPDGTDPWADATEHLISAPSPDDAFATLTEALL